MGVPEQGWLGKSARLGEVEFLPDFSLDAGNRRFPGETTAPESLTKAAFHLVWLCP